MYNEALSKRFWQKVDKNGPAECWPWIAGRGGTNQEYGMFYVGKRHTTAHRVAYELLVGPVPDGLQLDHLCRNKICVNPSHLEPVTSKVNVLRGTGLTAINARKTHCSRGHFYDSGNTYVHQDKRYCRECGRIRHRIPSAKAYEGQT